MNAPYEIRTLDRLSLDEIAGLWYELNHHHFERTHDFSDYYSNNTFERRKADLLAKQKLVVFVAESEGQGIGFCVASVQGIVGEIDSLYTKSDFREQQLGSRLMERGLDWLDSHQVKHIRLMVGEGNEGVFEFYEKFGFRKRATQLEKL